jgi:hypothetical protein
VVQSSGHATIVAWTGALAGPQLDTIASARRCVAPGDRSR